jgi:DNA-binding transcriptional LysR family regulator
MMDWDKLRIFVAVAYHSNFTKAAASLYLSPSAVSRQISDLEYSLKSTLFNRHSRGVTITESGEILLKAAQEVYERLEETENALKLDRNEAAGPLKIATTHALSSAWLTIYLKEFLELYPNIELSIIGNDEELDLKVRQADVAIRTALNHQTELHHLYLTTFHLQLYASEDYLKKFGTPAEIEDLDNHRLIVFGDNVISPFGNVNWLLNVGLKPGQAPRSPYLRINSTYGLRRCAEEGLGVIAMSREYAEGENLNLVHILPKVVGPRVKIYYVFPESLAKVKRFTVLGEFLRKKIIEKSKKKTNF